VTTPRRWRAGESIEDYCRACKTDRVHNVIVVDGAGRPLRVQCGYCESQHNYRGGPRIDPASGQVTARPVSSESRQRPTGTEAPALRTREPGVASAQGDGEPLRSSAQEGGGSRNPPSGAAAAPIVSERERTAPLMPLPDRTDDLELLLRRIIREEAGVTPVAPAPKWRGGTLVLRPGTAGLQEKTWPIETFFHKIVMLRNRLRTLEQQVNVSDMPDDVKLKLQGYVTGCYGSLTSFNLLFANEDDQFKGSGGD
jgi:hypothetical protein